MSGATAKLVFGAALAALAPKAPAQAPAQGPVSDSVWAAVDSALGRAGQMQAGDVRRYAFPRSDLAVTADGVALRPAFALGSWVAFGRSPEGVRAMGDLVLLEREVGPVLSELQAAGIQPTALHNHLLGESPRVMYLHLEAEGEPRRVARGIRRALARTGTPPAPRPPAAAGAPRFPLDTARLARILGRAGTVNGGVYQVGVPRAERVVMEGVEIPPAMGVATALNFQPIGAGRAAVTGDFVLTAAEVDPVVRELGAAHIRVTALHSHMLLEEPRLFFLHFWGRGEAAGLAAGLRAALDRMHVRLAGP